MVKTPFFFHSDAGSVLPLALRLKAEGHPVMLYIREENARDIGRNLVPKTTTPTPSPRSIVIFDGVGHGAVGKVLRKQGHPVIGGNMLDHDLEVDRIEGARLMQQMGLRVPEYHAFRSFPAAIKFLEAHEGQWFVKVSGDQIESATFDTPDAETMIRYLQWCDRKGGKVEPFELQRRVEGTELSLNGWFDGDRFVRPFDATLEEKKFLTGELGPRTGCESNLVWCVQSNTLANQVLLPLEDQLAQSGYVGALDLNMRVNEAGIPSGLEWTARFGYDALYAWMQLLAPPVGEQLEAFATGTLSQWDIDDESQALTLRVSIPPYPTWDTRLLGKTKDLPLDAHILSNDAIAPVDVMQTVDGPRAAGGSAVICAVSAVGTSLKALRQEVLNHAKALEIPNKQYRLDPVDRAERDLKALEAVL